MNLNTYTRRQSFYGAAEKVLVAAAAPPESAELIPDVSHIANSAPSALSNYQGRPVVSGFDGEKWPGGFGDTHLYFKDYYTLRARSNQLFTEDLTARGIVDRIVDIEIGPGLTPECTPLAAGVGMSDDEADIWGDEVERKFDAWGDLPWVCDIKGMQTFGGLQYTVRRESLVEGDILVVLRQNRKTKLPYIQLISGSEVIDPTEAYGNPKIKHGVEMDKNGKPVAYHIRQGVDQNGNDVPDATQGLNFKTKRIPAFDKNGRPIAWLVYGIPKRMAEHRGEPLLSVVLQSLSQIASFREATLTKAEVSALFAMFVTKELAGPGTLPLSGAGTRLDDITVIDNSTGNTTQTQTKVRAGLPAGVMIEELNPGEKPEAFDSKGTNEKFGEFNMAMLLGVCFGVGFPKDVMLQDYKSNYTASMAANNDVIQHNKRVRKEFADSFTQKVYEDWLISQVLLGKITAPGLLASWRNPTEYEQYAAWVIVTWYGSVKPNSDPKKTAQEYQILIDLGLYSRRRAAREGYGVDFAKQVKQLARDEVLLAAARAPALEQAAQVAGNADTAAAITVEAMSDLGDKVEAIMETLEALAESSTGGTSD